MGEIDERRRQLLEQLASKVTAQLDQSLADLLSRASTSLRKLSEVDELQTINEVEGWTDDLVNKLLNLGWLRIEAELRSGEDKHELKRKAALEAIRSKLYDAIPQDRNTADGKLAALGVEQPGALDKLETELSALDADYHDILCRLAQ